MLFYINNRPNDFNYERAIFYYYLIGIPILIIIL